MKMKTQKQSKPAAHTPKPWIFDTFNSEECVIKGANGQIVHLEDFGSLPDEAIGKDEIIAEMRANCYLIAAAPDGYQFAKSFLSESWKLESDTNTELLLVLTMQAESFIAKAECRSWRYDLSRPI